LSGKKIVLAASDSESSEYLHSTWRQMLLAALPARYAHYMGADWSSMAGMDPAIDGDKLITTVAEAAHNPRNWVLIPEDGAPAVSFDAMNSYGALAFEQRFGKVILRRFDRRD